MRMTAMFCALALVLFLAVPAGASTSAPEWDGAALDSSRPEAASDAPRIKIPSSPVHMFIRSGQQSRFELFFLDVKYDYDLVDFEFYKAWCLERGKAIRRNAQHSVKLYSCYDPDLPEQFRAIPWNPINYIINHKRGSKKVIQQAIWYVVENGRAPAGEEARELAGEALEKGGDFKPSDGQLMAVVCHAEGKQLVFLELAVPDQPEPEAAPVAAGAPAPVAGGGGFPFFLAPVAAIPVIPFLANGSSDDPSSPHKPPTPPPTPHPVPEPGTLFLLGSGIGLIGVARKLRRKGSPNR